MREPEYHLYLTTCHCQESHSLNVRNSSCLQDIRDAIEHIIKAMFDNTKPKDWWWYGKDYARKKADEFTKKCEHMLDEDAVVTKEKIMFFNLGFIITNYPMWPDNKGGYESEFYI